ncbi:hypothetical protein [Streptomyces sp. NPDC055186]
MALSGLGYEHEAMMRQLRNDLFAVPSSAHEPPPEPARSQMRGRFAEADLKLRASAGASARSGPTVRRAHRTKCGKTVGRRHTAVWTAWAFPTGTSTLRP